jgi:hypothetical protein
VEEAEERREVMLAGRRRDREGVESDSEEEVE